jgi:hypothetical protein
MSTATARGPRRSHIGGDLDEPLFGTYRNRHGSEA